ncbi:hypothetical protein J8I87_41595 [Paraburkholderia sp. LEh10]|uniref:hypothetical protein n=1 Tax=Paraburkholderia sp. LEh10 TaxID=2821353 RepID=UPI001AE10EE4|nr:hypothetical protein [Paraburkholderia sp. LEh10]MBP0596003.1 hypothetical protein [Paraburkholderia sp. LEh10]
MQLLTQYPEIADWIEHWAKERHRKNGDRREVLRGLRHLHRGFLLQCRHAGVLANRYPFNQLSRLRTDTCDVGSAGRKCGSLMLRRAVPARCRLPKPGMTVTNKRPETSSAAV